ncbi:MAG: cell wall hydrolase, partial [Sphingomonas sp.]|nr:cell wall hydrolase [Sphingomonas sp.]
HARIAAPAPPAPMVAALAAPATPVTPPAQIQPAYAESGTPVAGAGTLPESQILDKWKDSGKPLR